VLFIRKFYSHLLEKALESLLKLSKAYYNFRKLAKTFESF
jgi:hypothetical protein